MISKNSKRGARVPSFKSQSQLVNSKRSQFYIMAAVIIIAVIIGIATISNYANIKKPETKIYELGKELGLETGEVVSYGVYQQQDTDLLIKNWTNEYYRYAQESGFRGDWVFVYGDSEKINVLGLTNSSAGEISLIMDKGKSKIPVEGVETKNYSFTPDSNEVSIEFNKLKYSMRIKEGENFFFVIRQGEYAAQG